MSRFFLLLGTCLVAITPTASAATRRVVLIDTSSDKIEQEARAALPGAVDAELKRDGRLELVATSDTAAALSAQKKDPAKCAKNPSCLKAVARKVNADLILTASVTSARKKGFVLTMSLGSPDAMKSAPSESESMRLLKSLAMNVPLCLGRLLPTVEAAPAEKPVVAAKPAAPPDFSDLPPIAPPEATPPPSPAPAPVPAAPVVQPAPAGPKDKCQAKVGDKAPPFSISMSDGSEGVMLRRSLEKKVPVVVAFWAYHCKPCQKELPMLQKLSEEVGGQVSFLLIHDGPDEALMKAKLAELNVTLPSASDDQRAKEEKYCVTSLPKTFVIESDGKSGTIRAIFDEANDKDLRSTLAGLGVKVSG